MDQTISDLIKTYNFNPLPAETAQEIFVATVEIICLLKNKKNLRTEDKKFVDGVIKKIRCEETSGSVLYNLLNLCSANDLRQLYNEHFKKSFNLVVTIAEHAIERKFGDILHEIIYHWSMIRSKYLFFSTPQNALFLY